MPSILPGYSYDIFLSYRQKDNKGERWVTEFVKALKEELDATFKEDISIYFDENPHDGLLESHHVNKSLEGKLRSLIFIPILSQTYCDPKSFAWQEEFCAFNKLAKNDVLGREINLSNGNVASRILPIKIHDLDPADKNLIEQELGDVLRAIEFIFKSPGVNRPLRAAEDRPQDNLNKTFYRDQINKVANAIKAIVEGAKASRREGDVKTHEGEKAQFREEVPLARKVAERDLGKVALVYIIAALLLWKASDLIIAILGFDQAWSQRIAVVMMVMFPLFMFLAWRYEKGPTGFVRIGSAAARTNPLPAQERKPLTSNTAILALLVVMLGLYFIPGKFITGSAMTSESTIDNKSIAVLYFDNMSGDVGQDYLSDGLTEEIITRLTKIPGLRVISRTSVRVYKGQPLNLKRIADDLNVSVVLEGSVRKSGNQLRVTAQLINADTDEHLWAESYDRELEDVFEVQKEIAQVIADKFKIAMSPETNIRVNEISTKNTEAYDYYLKGRHIAFTQYYFIGDSLAFLRSKAMYERAIEIDPTFALAIAGLADLYDSYRALNFQTFTKEMDSLRHSLSWEAYQLEPNSAFVNNVRIWMLINRDGERLFDSAFYHARKALQLEPNDYYNHESMASIYSTVGLDELAIPFLKKAINLNPLAAELHGFYGGYLYNTGQKELSDKEFQMAYDLAPVRINTKTEVAYWLIEGGRLDEAEELLKELNARSSQRFSDIQFRLCLAKGQKKEAWKLAVTPLQKLFYHASFDNMKEARELLNGFLKRFKERGVDRYLTLKYHVIWKKLHNEPMMKELLKQQEALHEANRKKYALFAEGLIPGE